MLSDVRLASCLESVQKGQAGETEQKHLDFESGDDLPEIVRYQNCDSDKLLIFIHSLQVKKK